MSAGNLVVSLLMNTGSFETDTKRAERRSKQMAAEIDKAFKLAAGAAVAAGGAFLALTYKVINNADATAKAARSIGITTEALSSLQHAADLSGLSSQELNQSLIRLNKAAADGNKAFAAMGVQVRDARGNLKSTDALLKEVSDKFASYADGAEKSALAQELFGRSGANMISFLNAGSAGLTEMQEEAEKLGIVISGDLARASEQFNDNISRIQKSVMGLVVQIAGPLVNALAAATTEFLKAAQGADTFFGALERGLKGGVVGDRSTIEGAARDIERLTDELAKLDRLIAQYDGQEIPINLQFERGALSADLAAAMRNYEQFAAKLALPTPDAPTQAAPTVGGSNEAIAQRKQADKEYHDWIRGMEEASANHIYKVQSERLDRQSAEERAYADWMEEMRQGEEARYLERLEAREEADKGYWERWLESADEAMTSFDDLAAAVLDRFASGFGNAFEKMVFDSQNLGDAVRGMAESMARSIVNALGQMAAQWLAYQAVQMVVGKTTQASASTAQTFGAMAAQQMAAINAFASTAAIPIVGPAMAPAAAGAALAATSPFVATVASLGAAAVGARATGGPVSQGAPYLVGERGPELFMPNTAGSIVPNNKLNGGGNVTINLIEDKSRAGKTEERDNGGMREVDVFVADILGDGPRSKAVQKAFGLQRRGY